MNYETKENFTSGDWSFERHYVSGLCDYQVYRIKHKTLRTFDADYSTICFCSPGDRWPSVDRIVDCGNGTDGHRISMEVAQKLQSVEPSQRFAIARHMTAIQRAEHW